MSHGVLSKLLVPPDSDDTLWELFHENSKGGRYSSPQSPQEVRRRMDRLLQALPFDQYPAVDLPSSLAPLTLSLQEAITTRVTARQIEPVTLSLEQLAAILHYGYGVNRDNKDTVFPRPFRVVPSGGALYPLEIFVHTSRVAGLEPGLYHYNPTRHDLRLLREGDETRKIADAIVQNNLAVDTSLILFITAVFERSVFKYGDRGYRFTFLEAGHVAQNINLVTNALELGCVNIGGYFDRQIDELLGLDGLTHSTIYLLGVGRRAEAEAPLAEPL